MTTRAQGVVERLRKPVMLHSSAEQTNAERREAADLIETLVRSVEGLALETTEEEREGWRSRWVTPDTRDVYRLLRDHATLTARVQAAAAASEASAVIANENQQLGQGWRQKCYDTQALLAVERTRAEALEAALRGAKATFDTAKFAYDWPAVAKVKSIIDAALSSGKETEDAESSRRLA